MRHWPAGLSRDELETMFRQYTELSAQLFTRAHLVRLGPDATEDTGMDLATWVVMQGEALYRQVHADPTLTPTGGRLRGPSFASMIVREYRQRFGVAIT